MEFAGFNLQHQLQEESAQCITSASTPPWHKPSTSQSWIPSNIYNGYTNGFLTESFTNSREYAMIDSIRTSTGQAFGFQDGKILTQQQSSDVLPPRIKGEDLSNDDLPKLSEIMNSFSKVVDQSSSLISMREPQYSPSFFSSRSATGKEFLPAAENLCLLQKPIEGGMALNMRCNFGRVSSISNLPSHVTSSLPLNSQMLDLSTSCGLQLCYDTFGLNEESISLSHSNMHGRLNSPSNKISSFMNEVTMTKRPSNCSQVPKECEARAKKSRYSCPPLKVRKEKLGDRIQTLQRLVAPFGKTSTVAVLSEAIGYIHFLHEQIQTLSIPYMKSAQSKPPRMMQLGSRKVDSREFKPDLRSRGLCLVPLSYASFIHRCD